MQDANNNLLLEEECAVRNEYMNVLRAEISLFKKKIKNWFDYIGDNDIKYFHNLVKKTKQTRKKIQDLKFPYGSISKNQNQIKEVLLSYYIDLLGSMRGRLRIYSSTFNKDALLNDEKLMIWVLKLLRKKL